MPPVIRFSFLFKVRCFHISFCRADKACLICFDDKDDIRICAVIPSASTLVKLGRIISLYVNVHQVGNLMILRFSFWHNNEVNLFLTFRNPFSSGTELWNVVLPMLARWYGEQSVPHMALVSIHDWYCFPHPEGLLYPLPTSVASHVNYFGSLPVNNTIVTVGMVNDCWVMFCSILCSRVLLCVRC